MAEQPVSLPFADRAEAARLLARRLAEEELPPDTVILGIPRGGVPVAAGVARELGLALDVVVAHKLGAPGNPEYALGAATADGTVIVEPWARDEGEATDAYLAAEAESQVRLARERERSLRGGRPRVPLTGRTVVIVDDGIATGATAHVAVLAARAAGASRVIVAAPIAASDTLSRLATIADRAIALATPEPFRAVGLWYLRFDQVDDRTVAALLSAGRTAG